jgi:cellulose synthase/poly-beta-1,6-N-acetylglucosamine synthase-like glycosyltransferase
MIYLAIIILIFTSLQFLVAIVNLVTDTHLPRNGAASGKLVSVLIPARNEDNNIGSILEDLRLQDYRNIEVMVFNDQSEDRTPEVVTYFTSADNRFSLVNSCNLPEGWLGKNHACHSLADLAKGSFMLFLDADVRIGKTLIGDAVSYSENKSIPLISVFPQQIMKSPGEKISVPNMNYILLSLLPLTLVRKSRFPSLSAANGQFMFFNSEVYRKMEPHKVMKKNKVEDISIARYFKKNGLTIACMLGDDRILCRMYNGYFDAVRGFSKNVLAFFGNSFLLAIIFWLISTLGFVPVLLFLPPAFLAAYILMYLTTRIAISVSSRQNMMKNLICILPLQFSMGMFIWNAFLNKYFRKFEWKGRNIN